METVPTSKGELALWRKALHIFLTFAPLVYLITLIVRYKVDIPVWDQWQFVPLLEKSFQGTLSLRDFWAQHNEHRLLFPRIIMLILARLSGWNISYELATNLLLAFGLFVALAYQTKSTLRSIGYVGTNWLIPITSLVVFSLVQLDNWLWGWQIQIFLNVLAVIVGIILLATPAFKWSRFLTALFLGVVATFSFANGLCYWPIGLLILFSVPNSKKTSVVLWTVAGLAVISLYFYNYHRPPHHPPLWAALEQPMKYVSYVFSYLGAFVANSGIIGAFIAGSFGLLAWGCMILLLIRRRFGLQALIPYVGFSLYSMFSALVTGIARAGFGSVQAITSRYTTISYLLWFSNVVFLYLLIVGSYPEKEISEKSALTRFASFSALAIMVFQIASSSIRTQSDFGIKYHYLSPARDALLAMDNSEGDDSILTRLCWSVDLVKKESHVLKKYHLSLFRNSIHSD
jgi:hypothetical protein